jgi:hypothetical protein
MAINGKTQDAGRIMQARTHPSCEHEQRDDNIYRKTKSPSHIHSFQWPNPPNKPRLLFQTKSYLSLPLPRTLSASALPRGFLFSVFYFEIMISPDLTCQLMKQPFDCAILRLGTFHIDRVAFVTTSTYDPVMMVVLMEHGTSVGDLEK